MTHSSSTDETLLSQLPEPSPEMWEQCHKVQAHIKDLIQAGDGLIPFSAYMEAALYTPGLGYYAAGASKFGLTGDFTTAPLITPMFSHCVARQLQEILATCEGDTILELGAGTGQMAADILHYLAHENALPKHYLILEISPDLQQRQLEAIAKIAPDALDRVTWLKCLPDAFNGAIVANEVLDAIPVERFKIEQGRCLREYVSENLFAFDSQFKIDETFEQHEVIEDMLTHVSFAEGYQSEVSLLIPAWLRSLSDTLKKGAVLFIDYGFLDAEYYHPERNTGTLMCHYQHHAHSNPFILPGIQDITAHVNYSQVAQSAIDAGFELGGYEPQGNFLTNLGILDHTLPPDGSPEQLQQAQALKKLLMPHEMGELFKAMVLLKDLDCELSGFGTR